MIEVYPPHGDKFYQKEEKQTKTKAL